MKLSELEKIQQECNGLKEMLKEKDKMLEESKSEVRTSKTLLFQIMFTQSVTLIGQNSNQQTVVWSDPYCKTVR